MVPSNACVHVRVRVCMCVSVCVWNPARTLAAAILSRENREQRERSRYAASWGKGMGTAGSDPLLGARPEDLGRAPIPLEEEIFKHAAEVSADPSVITAYFPPVARDHPSVHPSYSVNRDKKDKPVSWIYCMTVSVWHSCSREAEIVAANTVSGFVCSLCRIQRASKWAPPAGARRVCTWVCAWGYAPETNQWHAAQLPHAVLLEANIFSSYLLAAQPR